MPVVGLRGVELKTGEVLEVLGSNKLLMVVVGMVGGGRIVEGVPVERQFLHFPSSWGSSWLVANFRLQDVQLVITTPKFLKGKETHE